MNHFSSDSVLADPAMALGPPAASRTTLIGVAWIGTLLLSALPLIIARDVLGGDIPAMTPIWLGTAALFVAATYARPALKPLRGYFALLGVIILLGFVVEPLVSESAAWQRLVDGQPFMVSLFGSRVLKVLLTFLALLVVFSLGYSRREAFLTAGNLAAPIGGLKLPGGRRLSWAIFGTVMSLLLAAFFFSILRMMDPGAAFGPAVRWLPLILVTAGLNGFHEEAMFRAGPMATLLGAVGPRHAVFLTAIWFGLGHYYGGIPSGPVGAVGVSLLALLLGKAMLDTRGMGWSWIIHVAIDTTIYIVLVGSAAA